MRPSQIREREKLMLTRPLNWSRRVIEKAFRPSVPSCAAYPNQRSMRGNDQYWLGEIHLSSLTEAAGRALRLVISQYSGITQGTDALTSWLMWSAVWAIRIRPLTLYREVFCQASQLFRPPQLARLISTRVKLQSSL